MSVPDKLMERVRERVLSGTPWTYDELCRIGYAAGDTSLGRFADKLHGQWRRKGWAGFRRAGRDTLWELTDAGRAALSTPESSQ